MTNEELCLLYQNGNTEALGDLYKQNRGLIEKIVRRYGTLEDPEDLAQESFFAIRQAAALWDHSKDAKFSTYCTYWIIQVLNRYICSCAGIIRRPESTQWRIRQYNNIVNAYRVQFGRDPSKKELCYILEVNPQQLENLRRDIVTLHTRSASEPIREDGEETIEDFLKDDSDPIGELLDRLHIEELHKALERELDEIPEREADAIRMRYYKGLTLKETGAAIGVSTERARQLESGALRKLRRPKAAKRLQAYFTDGGAYTVGLRGTGLTTFKNDHTSAQERAVIKLEERIGKIWENPFYAAKYAFNGAETVE